MKLAGVFRGFKSGTFTPQDGDGESYPFAFAKVVDEDNPDAGYMKVKPASSDEDDVAEFADILSTLKKGDRVAWSVAVDRYGNTRLLAVPGVAGK